LCLLVAGRAALVHIWDETECLAEAWASACNDDTRGELLGGCRPCRRRVASLCVCDDTSKASWLAAALHKSAVRSWRPQLCVVVGRCASQISRQIMATTAIRRRVHEGRDKLSGPLSTALVHRTDMIAKYISGTVTGASWFCVRRLLRPPSPHSAGCPRLYARDWLELRACSAGDALPVIISASTVRASSGLSGLYAYKGSDLASDPGLRGQACFTRSGFLKASCPAARI
jgi:hypothetical protein